MLLKDINPGTGSGPGFVLTNVGNTLYFGGNDGVNGSESVEERRD